jgi:hypothetical protein
VRRASVTVCLQILEGEYSIRSLRGRVLIRNRAALEASADGAYGACEREAVRLGLRPDVRHVQLPQAGQPRAGQDAAGRIFHENA